MGTLWLTGGRLVTPRGVVDGSVAIAEGRIRAIRANPPRRGKRIPLDGGYLAPGFIDLHVWGPPEAVSREAVKSGTAGFLTTLGPASPQRLAHDTAERAQAIRGALPGAECLGVHLEGPFVNRARAGALPKRSMRRATAEELTRLARAAGTGLRLLTLAPELPGALAAVRWCVAHGIAVSLGHSAADADAARQAVKAGARLVTHVFNGMRPRHHRSPSLLDVALTDPRLTTMVIADGIHVSQTALRLLVQAKGSARVILVTDSITLARSDARARGGAWYTPAGVLAGSRLTMIAAVRNAVRFGALDVAQAVRMASEVPARALGLARSRGSLEVGKRADLVAFDRAYRVLATWVGGRLVFASRTFSS